MFPEIRTITPQDFLYSQMLTLRHEVLRKPLGMSVYEDDLSKEVGELLLVAVGDGEVGGCLIIRKLNATRAKLRQMAVSEKLQGKGIGAKLIAAAEETLIQKTITSIELNARATAVSFYEKLGYQTVGETFMEVGIPHLLMQKSI